MSLKIKTKSRFNLQLFWNVWIPLPPLSPRNPHTPASLHLTFPLATRVHMRRPSDFRFTFANTVAVIHNKASCCFHFVLVQLLPGWFYIGHKTQSLRDVFRWHGSKIYEEAVIKIEENYSLKCIQIDFPALLGIYMTEFARLDCVIISLVICLTSVSGPRSMGTLVHTHRE